MKRFLNGLLAGTVATVPMSLVMLVLHRFPTREPQPLPPEQITQTLAEEVAAQVRGVGATEHLDKPQLQALTLANHFGFGAAAGGIYALLSPRVAAPPVVKGALWGLVVWSVSYLGWLPATRILPPATQQSPRRNFLMIAAHLVWGVSAALVVEQLSVEETL
jgi:uncharacterized membrane protein YagU involved in acid resistance